MLGTSIKFVELTFENIDYIVVPICCFCKFLLMDESNDGFTAKLMLVLNNTVNDVALNFDGSVYSMQCEGQTLFERIIQYRDLTHIKLICDDAMEEYCVVWLEEKSNEYRNSLQSACLDENGNLCVEIITCIRD